MKNKLALFIDDSQSYLQMKFEETYKSWGYNISDVIQATEWKRNLATSPSLFSNRMVHLNLEDKKDLSNFVELIDKRKKNGLFTDEWFGNGVIITSTYQKGSSKVVKLVKEFGGVVLEKQKVADVKKELLKKLKIKKDIENFISDFVGEDYEMLLTISNSILPMTEEEKKNLDIDKILSFLPREQGEIPPWDFVDLIFTLDVNNCLQKLKRITIKTHPMIIIALLRNKMILFYEYILLDNLGIKNVKDKAERMNVNSWYQLTTFQKLKNLPTLETVEYMNKLVYKAEESLKGGGLKIDESLFFEEVVCKLILSLKCNKPLENL